MGLQWTCAVINSLGLGELGVDSCNSAPLKKEERDALVTQLSIHESERQHRVTALWGVLEIP